jgi:hypothetical protein
MKRIRFRLSTIMLLIVVVALCVALVVQNRQAALREREMEVEIELLARQIKIRDAVQAVNEAVNARTVPAWKAQSTEAMKDYPK